MRSDELHSDRTAYAIGEAAYLVGVSPGTIRIWEREGLIAPTRTQAGYRLFSESDIARLRKIAYLRHVEKFNLAAIKHELANGHVETHGENDRLRALGRKLRQLRRERGLTLQLASQQADISTSFLSAIERGLAGASLATLHRLLTAYGVTFEALMEGGLAGGEKLIRAGQRPVFYSTEGITIENLARTGVKMEPQWYELEPGASSDGEYSHEGEEFILVLEGTFDIWLDEMEHYRLEPGDSLYFPSSQRHRWENRGSSRAVLLWVNTPPTF